MKIKTSELEGAALDWAVAKAAGMHVRVDIWAVNGLHWPYEGSLSSGYNKRVFPSSDWSQGGPLIEKYRLAIVNTTDRTPWLAMGLATKWMDGPTLLIAAMRALVACQLGHEVDVPDELMEGAA